MIAKGNTHCDGVKLADYLLMGGPGERAELLDMRGFATGDLRQAFADIEMVKEHATKADAAFFHVQIRGADGEGKKLTRVQWIEIANGCDLALGRAMTHQARAASLHIDEKTGDMHLHLAYSLIRQADDGRCFVERLGKFENKLQLYAREIELKYGLQILSNERKPGARRADRNELEESRRLGTDINAVRNAILEGFQKSDNGKAFDAAMKDQGFIVAGGDRNCYVIVDELGGKHALNKKLTGMTLKEIDARLGDLDRASLPSVDQAKQIQQDRSHAREPLQARDHDRDGMGPPNGNTPSHGPEKGASVENPRSAEPEKNYSKRELGQTAGEIRTAWAITRHRGADELLEEIEKRGLILVHVSRDESGASYRAREFAKSIKRQNRALKEGFAVVDTRGNVTRIDQRVTGDLWEEIQKRLGGINRDELLSVGQAREVQAEARKIEFAEMKHAEREAARPKTEIEQQILDAAAAAGGDRAKFSAECEKAGLGLARVTAADIKGLDALRRGIELERVTASSGGDQQQRPPKLDDVREGELAAVTKAGDVLKLNQQHMAGLEGMGLIPPHAGENPNSRKLPSVIELRAAFEIERDELAKFQKGMIDIQLQRRDDAAAERLTSFQERAANQEVRQVVGQAERAAELPITGSADVIDKGLSGAARIADIALKVLETGYGLLFGWASAPAPMTHDQAELAAKAGAEHQQQAADLAAYRQNEALRSEQIERRDEEQSQRLTAPEYFRHINRPGEPSIDDGRERERERER